MIRTLIIYAVFVLPIALIIYKKDKSKFVIVKTLNLIITFIFFYLLSNNLKANIIFLKNHFYELYDVLYLHIGIVSPTVNYINFFANTVLSFVLLAVMVGLAFRNKRAYNCLKYLLPVIWISDVVLINFKVYDELKSYAVNKSELIIFFYIFIIMSVKWGLFFLIYNLKKFKLFFIKFKLQKNDF